MPYIPESDRPLIDRMLSGFVPAAADFTSGRLTYLLTRVVLLYWRLHPSYAGINAITGSLENAKQEFYRRVAGPYEMEKCETNGDVYQEVP